MGLKKDLEARPVQAAKWREVKDYMSTHVFGTPPTRIYKTRRPLESSNEYALVYREENYQPITKQPFHVAIMAILEAAGQIFVQETNIEDQTADYLQDLQIKAAGNTYDHKSYIIEFIGRVVESDPNAVLIHFPVHPTESFIPDYREELPNFDTITNQYIDIELRVISSDDIHLIDEDEIWYYGGEYIYALDERQNEKLAPYYWLVNRDVTRIAIPYETSKKQVDYTLVDYYANALENAPFVVLGHNTVMEEIDGDWVQYQESTYAGAVAVANKMLGLDSDNDILQTRYTYPEKYLHMERCDYPGCVACDDPDSPFHGLYVNYLHNADETTSTCSVCSSCGGSGQVAPDTSPLGTHYVAKSDVWSEDGKFTPLIGFVTPPLEAPKHMAEQVEKYWDKMLQSLFIVNQNMTNQSGESKSYDVRQKVTVITGAVKNIYSVYEKSLNAIQGFLLGAENVELIMPPDYNIKTSQDITIELAQAKSTSSVYQSELTKELLLKKFGDTAVNRRAVNFIELNDLLFGMGADEVMKAMINYPIQDRARLQVVHDKGWAVLQSLARDERFLTYSDEELKTLFDTSIAAITPAAVAESPIA